MLTVFFSQPRPRQVMGFMESQAKDTEKGQRDRDWRQLRFIKPRHDSAMF